MSHNPRQHPSANDPYSAGSAASASDYHQQQSGGQYPQQQNGGQYGQQQGGYYGPGDQGSVDPAAGQYPPTGQPAGYGDGQQYAAGGYGQQPHAPQQGTGFATAPPPTAGPRPDANPFRAAFDLSFNSFATPSLVKIVYILTIIIGAVYYLVAVLAAFYGANILRGLLAILFAWIPIMLWILFVRIILEFAVALIRTAEDTSSIRSKLDA